MFALDKIKCSNCKRTRPAYKMKVIQGKDDYLLAYCLDYLKCREEAMKLKKVEEY